ncbi:DUF2071 domain-containing protein [Nafulsella turpanensis]|uniref:DUF2071 domain-containing protein n=1 Tax=Nafulsella turpanensis TaxID=1265690 RepID=UPI0003457D8D|nr:DUF2071 domain-containing protein [Nafulsella turpanensis]
MFYHLKNHPFPVEAYFESSIVLTFAVPKEELEPLIPACLDLDLYNDQWAFIAVAMVDTKGLKPKALPSIFGNDFFLVGYRVFVKYINKKGKRLRGLYILKSETNKRKMEWLGCIFTHYNYSTTDIQQVCQHQKTEIKSKKSDFSVLLSDASPDISLPQDSPFPDWKAARRYAGPLPFTFTFLSPSQEVLIIEGVRQNWVPQPIEVVHHHFSYIESLGLKGTKLANAFIIKDVPYHWKKGRTESWGK